MEIIIVWIILCFIVAAWAGNRGRSRFGYFIISFFLSPIIGLLMLLAVGRTVENEARRQLAIQRATEKLQAK